MPVKTKNKQTKKHKTKQQQQKSTGVWKAGIKHIRLAFTCKTCINYNSCKY